MISSLGSIFFVLAIILIIQFEKQAKRYKESGKYTWFSNSKLIAGKWSLWQFILGLLSIGYLFKIIFTFPKPTFKNIIFIIILITIYWLTMKVIKRLTSFRIRLLAEFLLICILIGSSCLSFLGINNPMLTLHHNSEVYLQEMAWWEILQFIVWQSIFFIIVAQFIRYHLILWKKKKLQKELKLNHLKKELNIAQLEMLQARINPHFLYNSLNSIAGLALTDGENTRRMALSLSRFFSYCADKNTSHLIPVSEELEITKTYLDIEKIRFGERLDFQIIAKEETNDFLIPRLLLQPLVENSVKHGMCGSQEKLCITILVYPGKTGIHILVRDNGAPFPEDLVPGYGLKSIYDKLDILFPDNYEAELHNFPEKEISIRLIQKSTHEI